MSKELYKLTHSSPELETVGDYLNEQNSPGYIYNNNPEDFLNIVGEDGLTNRQRIEDGFRTPSEKQFIGVSARALPLKVGTLLYIEYEKVNQVSFVTDGIEVVSTNEPAFKAAKLIELESDPGYFQINKPIAAEIVHGISKQMYPDMTVWIWCRSLSDSGDDDDELQGQIFDLTPFIMKCSTNMSKNGGNFQISLPSLMCRLDDNNRWVLNLSTYEEYQTGNQTSIQDMGFVATGTMFNEKEVIGGDIVPTRNKFLFHNMINSNDLIFIRFETLDMEKNQRYSDSRKLFINKADIANRIYDMIGLVDSNTEAIDPATNSVSVNISGRDLSKLFIEDGTYFYALENSQGILRLAGQSTIKSSFLQRIFSEGALNFIGLYNFTSIEYIFKFVIQQLSNIKVIPDNLLSSYEQSVKMVDGREVIYDGRNVRYSEIDGLNARDKNTDGYQKQYKKELAKGIWQIIKLVIDESVSKRRLADSSFSTAQGSILNFLRTAAQEPLVEMYMDTYKDMYHLIVRKPPYDRKALISLIEGKVNTEDPSQSVPPAIVTVLQSDVLYESLTYDDTQVYSWYHFFPRNSLMGDAENYSLSYLPALYFPEYAEVFGSKPFQQSNSYLPYVPLNKNKGQLGLDFKQAVEDLKYVVESNQYIPFTRKGTITVNRDRRLKIGNIFRYEATGEIFFIDSVQHNFQISDQSIDAVTTISVSRGMVEQLIYGVRLENRNGSVRYVSYFNIIDTKLDFSKQKEYERKITRTKKVENKYLTTIQQNTLVAPSPNVINYSIPLESSNGFNIIQSGNTGIQYLEKYNKYPNNKFLFIRFINGINALGYRVILLPLATNRTFEEQKSLDNGLNAKAGTSKHEIGAAIDITIVSDKTGKTLSKNSLEIEWLNTGVPALANALGLQWGGSKNNGAFGNYIDRVHFQIRNTVGGAQQSNTSTIDEEYTETVKEKGLDLDGIFSNFKVNKYSFNFFLKKRQFSLDFKNVKSRAIYDNDGQVLDEVIIKAVKKKNGRK